MFNEARKEVKTKNKKKEKNMRSLKNIFNEEPVTISDEDFFRLAPVWTVKTELNYLTGAKDLSGVHPCTFERTPTAI